MPKTTSLILGDHFDLFIASQVDAGRYASVAEVIREGLRLVEQRERMMDALDAAIRVGLDSGVDETFSWGAIKESGKALAKQRSSD